MVSSQPWVTNGNSYQKGVCERHLLPQIVLKIRALLVFLDETLLDE
jgi:hypothetical protein